MKIYHDLNLLPKIKDEIILHYTGFMFGMGCSAFSLKGIAKISDFKHRNMNKGFITLFDSIESLQRAKFAEIRYEKTYAFLKQIWPANLTVLLSPEDTAYEHLCLDNKLAVRIPSDPLLRNFIKNLASPFLSTSVNLSNQPAENNLQDIITKYKDIFDLAILPSQVSLSQNMPSTLIDLRNDEIEVLREGSISNEELKNSYNYTNILFICVGNTCRSPLAEFIAKDMFKSKPEYKFSSAGLAANNSPIALNSSLILHRKGIDASDHLSRQVNDDILRQNRLILCMTLENKSNLIKQFPNHSHKIFSLGEFTGMNHDVLDPYGMDLLTYEKTYNDIYQLLLQLKTMI